MNMSHPELSTKQVDLFVDLFMLGNELDALGETSSLVRLVKKVRPHEYRLVVVEAWQLIRARYFPAARAMLEAADIANPGEPMLKVLLALCLMSQGDSLWRSYLDEVQYLPANEDVRTMVQTLEEFAQNCPMGASGSQMAVMATLLN
jgi:thioredoxin-like negative regulator of GroEL